MSKPPFSVFCFSFTALFMFGQATSPLVSNSLAETFEADLPVQALNPSRAASPKELTHARPLEPVVGSLLQCFGEDDTAALSAAVAATQWVVIRSGQTCASSDLTIPNLRIEDGGLLRPLKSHTITIANFRGGSVAFSNAFAGQGGIAFSGQTQSVNPEWWAANSKPGTTDMTAAIQAAIDATGGRGKVFFPRSSYLITDTLTIPPHTGTDIQSFSPVVLEGEGPFLSNLINKAPSGKPTLLVNRDLVIVRNLGFWGNNNFPNDGIKVLLAGRIYIESNAFFVKGNAIYLEKAQSIWIQNNYGAVSAGSALPPVGVTNQLNSYAGPTSAFVYVNIPDRNGYAHHIIIRDNMNEGYNYSVYTNNPTPNFEASWQITGNQFESSVNGGIKLDNILNFEISSNYLSEGGGGYAIDLNNCRYGRVGPNQIHTLDNTNTDIDDKISTVRLYDSLSIALLGSIRRVYLAGGTSRGVVAQGGLLERIQDESSDHLLTLISVLNSDIPIPLTLLNAQSGRATWYSDSANIAVYPTARLGDHIWKVTPTIGASLGWICTTASSAGSLVKVAGRGPDPVLLNDYAHPTAYDFRITILRGGVTGAATYKVEWKPTGTGSYADLTKATMTTELAHLIKNETGGGGPSVSFAIRWPTRQTYVNGDQWTLTAVVAPVWSPLPSR